MADTSGVTGISSMTIRANTDPVRGYKYTYDKLNRLTNAVYGEGTTLSSNANRFTEQVTGYDKNGNILGLKRYGQQTATTYGLIDNLSMTLNGNRLKEVKDAVITSAYNGGFEFKDYTAPKDTGGSGSIFDPPARLPEDEFGYDSNGNLTKDLNKNISSIQYNVLNLPNKVFFKDGNSISYLYGANGVKYRTIHKIGGITTTTDYCGNVIYENGTQKQLLTEAGYISLSDKKYHYYLQDHQGNNRVVINQTGGVEETNHYYPFGGVFSSTSSVQPYKYNGKELDTKNGLNWYDYGARMYDAVLGRFTTVDPMAEKYHSTNPYTYCLNNPLNCIDPFGTDTISVNNLDWSNFDTDNDVVALNEVSVQAYALTKVAPRSSTPIQSFWGYVGYYLLDIGAYHYNSQANLTYHVGTNGTIIGVAPNTGTPLLPGLSSTSLFSSIRSIWKGTRSLSGVRNAFNHWIKHSKEFPQFKNAKQYVEGAKNFLHNPPAGTLTKVRGNGDILRYNPNSNTFGVMDSNGYS